ncbi:MAG: hypothetical protein KGK16_09715, partial [Bradyrhizobium sp.]|nr:hypothetical protein [Bradyrhizobium sp.]
DTRHSSLCINMSSLANGDVSGQVMKGIVRAGWSADSCHGRRRNGRAHRSGKSSFGHGNNCAPHTVV